MLFRSCGQIQFHAITSRGPGIFYGEVVGERIKDRHLHLFSIYIKKGHTCRDPFIEPGCFRSCFIVPGLLRVVFQIRCGNSGSKIIQIARYKVPKYVFFVDEFPLTTSGKIQKYKLGNISLELLEKRKENGEL